MGSYKQRVTKKMTIYRNDDPAFKPVQYLFNSEKIKTFEKLLDDIERLVPPPRGGGLRSLWSPEGDFVYESLDEIINAADTEFVAVGPEGFKFNNRMTEAFQQADFEHPISNDGHPPSEERLRTGGIVRNDPHRKSDKTRGNGTEVAQVKKIQILRNGDPQFKPKTYFFRSKFIRNNWEKLFEDLHKVAPPVHGGPISHLYSPNGKEVEDLEEIEAGRTYVAAGIEGFKTVKNGYEHSADFDLSLGKNPNPEPDTSYVQQNKQKYGRVKSAAIHRRGSQVYPQNLFLYVFQNGSGLKGMRFLFTKLQLSKGMPWLLEYIGGKYKVDAKSLHTMDGRMIQAVEELIPKGAYVVVPRSEKFRDIWYYLAEGIIDTSKDSEDMKMYQEKLATRSAANSDSNSEDQWQHKRSQSADYTDREPPHPEADRFSRSTRQLPNGVGHKQDRPESRGRQTPPLRSIATSMTENNLIRRYSEDNFNDESYRRRRNSEARSQPPTRGYNDGRKERRDSDEDNRLALDDHVDTAGGSDICEGCGRCKHCGRADAELPNRSSRYDNHMPNINQSLNGSQRFSPEQSRDYGRNGDPKRFSQSENGRYRPEPTPSQNRYRLQDNRGPAESVSQGYSRNGQHSNVSKSLNGQQQYSRD